jgi:hypothetical protein
MTTTQQLLTARSFEEREKLLDKAPAGCFRFTTVEGETSDTGAVTPPELVCDVLMPSVRGERTQVSGALLEAAKHGRLTLIQQILERVPTKDRKTIETIVKFKTGINLV